MSESDVLCKVVGQVHLLYRGLPQEVAKVISPFFFLQVKPDVGWCWHLILVGQVESTGDEPFLAVSHEFSSVVLSVVWPVDGPLVLYLVAERADLLPLDPVLVSEGVEAGVVCDCLRPVIHLGEVFVGRVARHGRALTTDLRQRWPCKFRLRESVRLSLVWV